MKTTKPLSAAAVRIGDVERQRATLLLGEHWAAGRLEAEEFEERTALALAARTDGELAALLRDLPGGPDAPRASWVSISHSERGRLLAVAATSGLGAGFLGLVIGASTNSYRAHMVVHELMHVIHL